VNWRAVLAIGALGSGLWASGPARADDGALNEGLFGPEPLDVARGVESPIRLLEEFLRIEFGAKRSSVAVRFRFQNPDTTRTIEQLTGFPDISLGDYYVGWPTRITVTQGPLIDMHTFIDGQEVQSEVRKGRVWEDTSGTWSPIRDDSSQTGRNQLLAWHVVKLRIPPGMTVEVERRYSVTNGNDGASNRFFTYILHTAAAWKGTIGRLTVDLFLMKSVDESELDWPRGTPREYGIQCHPDLPAWHRLGPRHYQLIWADFEPATDLERQYLRVVWNAPGPIPQE